MGGMVFAAFPKRASGKRQPGGTAALILALGAVFFSSCATRFSARFPEAGSGAGPHRGGRPAVRGDGSGTEYRGPAARGAAPGPDERAVVSSAEALLGRPPEDRVRVNGRVFTLDCIGTVGAIYYRLSLDVTKDFPFLPGNGVGRLHESLRRREAIHFDAYPRPGDIIFWDNTWDADGDGDRTNDPLTHAGVVLEVDPDGTIRYVHAHHRRGVVVEVMNLLEPAKNRDRKGKTINSPLALGSGVSRRDNPRHWLSGDLWNSFGDILREKEYYAAAAGGPMGLGIAEPERPEPGGRGITGAAETVPAGTGIAGADGPGFEGEEKKAGL